MRINRSSQRPAIVTHEGAPAKRISPELALRRSVMACMLWEDSFYESGEDIATRIANLVAAVSPEVAEQVAVEARTAMKLRHVPLLVARSMAKLPKHKGKVKRLLPQIIQRPDELTEFLAIYWKEKRQPLSAQVKRGLAAAFAKFDEYALAKYDRDHDVRLRDVLFLSHSKPADAPKRRWTKVERGIWRRMQETAAKEGVVTPLPPPVESFSPGENLYRRVVDSKLATPDTWEVRLSAGEDKRATFERLINERNLGALAMLRNLRNMKEAGVEKAFVKEALLSVNLERVLPFRFIAAARAVPAWEDIIEAPMLKCLEGGARLHKKTALFIDVSASMNAKVSGKSDLSRIDAACGLAILARELCEEVELYTFSDSLASVPPRRGFALRDAINSSQHHSGTYLGQALRAFHALNRPHDRIIVFTDEQSADAIPKPECGSGWVVNVAAERNGVGYGAWQHVDGWSEAIFDFIRESEKLSGALDG